MTRLRFDPRRPLFIALPFTSDGKNWQVGEHYPWEEMQLEYQDDTVHNLFGCGFVHHNPELEGSFLEEAEIAVGDGLEQMPLDALHKLVDNINKKVKDKCKTEKEYTYRKCKKSTIKDRQIAHIRTWRRAYGHME